MRTTSEGFGHAFFVAHADRQSDRLPVAPFALLAAGRFVVALLSRVRSRNRAGYGATHSAASVRDRCHVKRTAGT